MESRPRYLIAKMQHFGVWPKYCGADADGQSTLVKIITCRAAARESLAGRKVAMTAGDAQCCMLYSELVRDRVSKVITLLQPSILSAVSSPRQTLLLLLIEYS